MMMLFLIAALWMTVALSYTRHPASSSPHGSSLIDHRRGHRSCLIHAMHDHLDGQSDRSRYLRRCCRSIAVSGLMPMLVAGLSLPSTGYARSPSVPPFPSRGFQTKSGLKYFDFNNVSEGPTPRYGQFVSLYYSMYYRPGGGTAQLELIDATVDKQPYLQKHGNGRLIRGLEEAIHTMRVGSRRRIIVPPSIGYSSFGLGPLPSDPFQRRRLGKVIDLVEARTGELVMDVELVSIRDDENDQGYYEDVPVTQEEVRQLVLKSLQADSPELMDRMKSSTPRGLMKP